MKTFTKRFLRETEGVTAIEYAMIAGLIAVALVGSLNGVEAKLVQVFANIVNSL
ncbi:Flp family type IVb pilin [Paraburkholderia sp.]|jgi:pilus assembly protein Flp/PilA|uniref:Flp family type IVb pilin n=1 Tax=Paraburkholderia sp. TaxID=1926495 RepID=UPI002F40D875